MSDQNGRFRPSLFTEPPHKGRALTRRAKSYVVVVVFGLALAAMLLARETLATPPDHVAPMVHPPGHVLYQWDPVESEADGWRPPMESLVAAHPPRSDLIDALDLDMPTLPADLSGVSRVRVVAYELTPDVAGDEEHVNVFYTQFSGEVAKHRLVYEGDGEGGLTLVYEVRIVDGAVEKHYLFDEMRADLNGDNKINSTDLAILLSQWKDD